uniref:AIG1-type G domain-containing protein n=1 Tax=Poecilia formosa TaxID=48698 RepID=A0A096LX20_POEFO
LKNHSLTKLISKSVQISSGHPNIYQPITKKKELETKLSKVTFGAKDTKQINKTILLVGETGSGKSSLVNAIFNHVMGVQFEDGVWFQIVDRQEGETPDVIIYEICNSEGKILPYSITIIDTPGYGNTKGIKHDDIVTERMRKLFETENSIHVLHAVGLVMKATDNRLSDRLMYIFDSVMSLFGNDMEKNIVALITHSNGRTPKNALQAIEAANLRCAKHENNQPVYFLFNNQQNEDRTDEEHHKNADTITMRGLNGFTAFLEKTAPRKLDMALDVLNERIRLSACIQNLQERIRLSELKEAEIEQIKEALKIHEKNKINDKVTVEFDEAYKGKEAIEGDIWLMTLVKGAVCCTICEENCHYPGCSTSRKPEDCEVMKDGRCTVCTLKCPASAHVKGKWRYVNKTKRVQRSLDEIKRKSKQENSLDFLVNLEKDLKKLKAEKSQLLEEALQHIDNLGQIALKVNSVSTFVPYDCLIEKLNDREEANKIRKLEEMK